jgi:3-dehydroquinate synthase
MSQRFLRVDLKSRSYDIALGEDCASLFGPFVQKRVRGRLAFVLADTNTSHVADALIPSLGTSGFRAVRLTIPPGEPQKSLDTASRLIDDLVGHGADRQSVMIAAGGGVIGDLAGFVAAVYARGIPVIMVPTTLLAMVDSSVGGKVGVNHPRAKNLIGAFHQPAGVWIDVAALTTLPEREFKSGLAEVVKYGMALDANLFETVENGADALLARDSTSLAQIIETCCKLKARIVERDELDETGLRAVLNFGHTFAHAVEQVTGYGTWLHGEAVSVGMVCACRLAQARGLIARDAAERLRNLLETLGLPVALPKRPVDDFLAAMQHDKKRTDSRIRFVLPSPIGQAAIVDYVGADDVRRVLAESMGEAS